ncbi:MAG: hypothetical protein ACJATT_005662 [Myxococcota bacterium]
MGKGRRSQGPRHAPADKTVASETSHEAQVGNAAQQADLDGRYIPMDAAGDDAKPVVERTRLALEIRYEGETPLVRLLKLLADSELEPDEVAEMSHRLSTTKAAENRVDTLVVEHFGGTPASARVAAEAALHHVATALRKGSATPTGWQMGDEQTEVEPATTVRAAVDGLIGGLAGARGTATVGLCRALSGTVFFDEEDED